MDRPSRKTKVVNYCESKNFDDDEDFACSKAPPSKKIKEDVRQEQRRSTSKSCSQETNHSMQNEKIRKPLDEKLYKRDLEAAITLSLLNPTDGLKDAPSCEADVKDENTDPASLHLSNCSVDAAVLGLDRITSERRSAASAGKAKAAEIQRTKAEDEDYQPKLTPDSESDEDYSEPAKSDEEEFTVKKVSKTKKKEKVTKPAPASKKLKQPSKPSSCKVQTSVRTPPSVKSAPIRPASSSTVSASKPAASLSPAGGRIPKWTPPAQIGKSPTSSQTPAGKSPGPGSGPGLRLGLSRLVRVKPLHPSVTSH